MIPLPVRPPVSLPEVLLYSFLAFCIALILTRPFVGFLHRFKLGKQLRVEAVDGGSASVFLTYHQKKAGTPTMGGLLIWGSILLTVLISRILALYGQIDHSLLQRGQVYIPLAIMVLFGFLGGLDDYLNIVSTDEHRMKTVMPKVKACVFAMFVLIGLGAFFVMSIDPFSSYLSPQEQAFNQKVALIDGVILGIIFFIFTLGGERLDRKLSAILIGQGKKRGLSALPKLFILIAVSTEVAYWFYARLEYSSIDIPFSTMLGLGASPLELGWLYIPFFILVVIGTANAVNVTDGLDGLAGGLLIIAFSAFGLVAFVSGLSVLAAFCGVIVGALAAFLWHNVPPAAFFMGDTGSLALGGMLAVMAFMINQVLILPLIGFIFVIEMLSVIIQLTSKRLRNGKKIFKSAPFHHHLEALGWGESKVTMRLWIIGGFIAFLGVLVGLYG